MYLIPSINHVYKNICIYGCWEAAYFLTFVGIRVDDNVVAAGTQYVPRAHRQTNREKQKIEMALVFGLGVFSRITLVVLFRSFNVFATLFYFVFFAHHLNR